MGKKTPKPETLAALVKRLDGAAAGINLRFRMIENASKMAQEDLHRYLEKLEARVTELEKVLEILRALEPAAAGAALANPPPPKQRVIQSPPQRPGKPNPDASVRPAER